MFDENSDRIVVQYGTAIDAQPKAKKIAATGLAEGAPATDQNRPLLRRPAPEFISGREMLDAVWRKSPWALDDDAFDYGLEYAVNSDLEMREFKRFVVGLLKLGFLPASAKFDGEQFRDVVSYRSEDAAIFIALMNGSPIEANVRNVATNRMAFPHGAPTVRAERKIWFKRRDVDMLKCDEDTVRHVMVRLAEGEAQEKGNAAAAAAIVSAMGWNMPVAPIEVSIAGIASTAAFGQATASVIEPVAGIASTAAFGQAEAIVSEQAAEPVREPVTAPAPIVDPAPAAPVTKPAQAQTQAKRRPGGLQKWDHGEIRDLAQKALNGDFGPAPTSRLNLALVVAQNYSDRLGKDPEDLKETFRRKPLDALWKSHKADLGRK